MMNFVGDLKDKLGLEIDNLNLGGGYGIMYTENDDPVPYDEYIQHVSEVVKATAEKRGVKLPFILMEPGRSIIAPAGITLYTVGGIKDIKNVRKYVSVDAVWVITQDIYLRIRVRGGCCEQRKCRTYRKGYSSR